MFRCNEQNIGQHVRGRQVRAGVLMGGLALAWWLGAAEFGVQQELGWLIGVPIALSAYLLISGTYGICLFQSLRGRRGADYGTEVVLDAERRAQLRSRALLAVSASVLIAFAFAAAFAARV